MNKDSSTDRLREQLEEFALHMKPGTTKGKHRTAIFDTVELTKLVQHLIQEASTNRAIEELEKVLGGLPKNSNNEYTVVILDRINQLKGKQ